jgi:DNA-binding GntR family transcriptional regulator
MIEQLAGNSKSDKVYEFLKGKILSGAYKPGDRIIIRKISQELGVSDIPVREAIKQLTSAGMLEIKSHSSARITPLNIENLEEIFRIRVELETLATRLAAKAASMDELESLDRCVRSMEESLQNSDITSYTIYNREFHQLLYQASHSPVLIDMIDNLFMRSENSKMVFYHDPERLRTSNEEHRTIVQALRDNDEEKAAQVIRSQKQTGFQVVLNALKMSRTLTGN